LSFFAELKRRNVYKVGVAYLALGWVVIQATDTLTPALNLPEWMLTAVTWIGIVGFPFALLLAWAFELTPEGLKREEEVDRAESATKQTGQKLNYVIIGLLAVAVVFLLVDDYVLDKSAPATMEKTLDSSSVAVDTVSSVEVPAGRSPEKSIAVLPFVNMSSDPEQEYFSDGISEELLNLLARVPQLKVIARTSSFYYKGKDMPLAQIASELGVEHILEGSVRKAGNRVRITVQLIRASDSAHLWSETYDRTLEDIFAIQDQVGAAVVEQLKVTLLGEAPRVQATDPEAYALYLRALHLFNQMSPNSIRQAVTMYEQALEVDSNFSAAWAGLALAKYHQVTLSNENQASAMDAVNRALELNQNSAYIHASAGRIALAGLDLKLAASHIQKALELEPSSAFGLSMAAVLARNLRRYDEAADFFRQSIAHDPVNWAGHILLGLTYYLARRPDDAIDAYNNAVQVNPGAVASHMGLALSMLHKGEVDAALAACEDESFEGLRLFCLAIVQHVRGHKAESDAALAELVEKYGERMSANIAAALAVRGEIDSAFTWLNKASLKKEPTFTRLPNPYSPLFDNLRDDPRWLPFLESVGMAPDQLAAIEFNVTLPN